MNPSQIIRGVLTLGIGQVFSWAGAIVLTILLPRYLGDANLGKFTFAFAFTSMIGLLADLGTGTYLTKEVARNRASAASLTVAAMATRVPLSLFAAILVVVVVNVAGYDTLTKNVAYVLSVGIVLNSLGLAVLGSLQGLQRMKPLAVASATTKLAYAAIVAVFLVGGGGPTEVAIAWVASAALTYSLATYSLFRYLKLSIPFERHIYRGVLLGGLPFFVWQVSLFIYGQIDAVLLSFLTHDAVVGWYAAAYRIVQIPAFLPGIITTVLFPALSATAGDLRAFHSIARRSFQTMLLLTLPMGLGVALLADKLIELFGYPSSFTNSIVPIIILATSGPIVAIDMVLGTVINVRDRQRQWAMAGVAAAVLNPLLNLAAIPYTQTVYANGAIGAAAVTVLTELLMLVVGLRLVPRGVFQTSTLTGSLRCILAGLVMSACVLATREFPLVIPILVGAVSYSVTCLAFRAVSIGDVRQAQLQFLRRAAADL